MRTLFDYIINHPSFLYTKEDILDMEKIWKQINSDREMPIFSQIRKVAEYKDVYICFDGQLYYVLDHSDVCKEICKSVNDITCDLHPPKATVIL